MHQLIGIIFRRFFADKHGTSRGWQVFVVLTLFGGGLTAWFAWKASGMQGPPLHRSVYVALPAMFTGVGAILWLHDSMRRKRFARDEIETGRPVQEAITEQTRQNALSAYWVASILGVTFVPLIVWHFSNMVVREFSSLNWTPTPSEVVRFEMNKPWNAYEFRIAVVYIVNGRRFEAVVDAPTSMPVRSARAAQVIGARYQPGTQHELFVNPQNPREASLRRGPRVGSVIGMVTVPVVGFICIVASLRFMLGRSRVARAAASTQGEGCVIEREPWKRAA